DVYSLGAVLYNLLTGRLPAEGRVLTEVLAAVQAAQFPAPRRVNSSTPKPLDAICHKAMAARPEDRYLSAKQLAADLELWLSDQPVAVYRESLIERWQRWRRRNSLWALLATWAFVLGMLMWAGYHSTPSSPSPEKETSPRKVVSPVTPPHSQEGI